MANDLKPCPFCGGEASHATCTITRDRDTEGRKGTFTGHYINCIVCCADNQGIAEGFKTPEMAAEKWNRRTGAKDIEAYFLKLRFDEKHHLGLGDIRLTLGQQDELIALARPEGTGVQLDYAKYLLRQAQLGTKDVYLQVRIHNFLTEGTEERAPQQRDGK